MIIQSCIANPLTTIRTQRTLLHPGKVLMRIGDAVESAQIVAQATIPPDFRIVGFAQELGVTPQAAKSLLKVERGQAVEEGDVLAAKKGLGGRACRSPITGKIIGVGRGRLLLQESSQIERLNALVPGYVIEVESGRGLLIETVGALIQGLWGNGYEAYGALRVAVREAWHPIRPTHINISSQGAILVGGSTVDAETIEQANEMRVRGIIVGSVPTDLLPMLRDIGFPVVATEGLGGAPMSQAVFDLLRSLDGREAAISGDIGTRWHLKRPYVVVPMPTQVGQALQLDRPPAVGDRVRLLRGDYRGRSGTVEHLLAKPVQLETGARLAGAAVDIGEDDLVEVPYVNLERIL